MYRLTVIAGLAGLALAVIGFFMPDDVKRLFAYFYFYIPFLWLLWIVSVFLVDGSNRYKKIAFLWSVINIASLAILAFFSVGVENYYQSKGIDTVVFVMFFPVIFPVCFIFPSFSVGSAIGYSGVFGAISVWLEASVVAATQSILIVAVSRIASLRRKSGADFS